jgi:alkylation response protein AidB-like acyl-CoA dehydrogenase
MFDFSPTDEQALLLESVREIMKHYPASYFKKHDREGTYPKEYVQELKDSGILLLGVPEELGGTPVDKVTRMLVNMELARGGAPNSFIALNTLAISDMQEFGSEEQLKRVVDAFNEYDQTMCMAFTEPSGGSDSYAMTTTYEKKDGKIILNGQKTFSTGAAESRYALVMTKRPDADEHPKDAFTLFLVDLEKPGIEMSPLHKIGMHMISNCEIFFRDVELDPSDMVGEEGKGFLYLMENFEFERLGAAAEACGSAMCAFDDAAKYAGERVQFGKPIGSFQLIQEKLTDMKAKIETMRLLILQTAWEADQGKSLRLTSALVKRYCAQAAFEVIDDALQIHGGLGYTDESRVSRLWRDTRMQRIAAGTDEIMSHIVGRQIVKEYAAKQ